MKKLVFIALFLSSLHKLYALPVGNPSEPTLFHYSARSIYNLNFLRYGAGFYGDYVFNRHMKTDPGKYVDNVKLSTNAAYFATNFCQRVDLFVTLGATQLSLNTSLGAFNSADRSPLFTIETNTDFSYSTGARVALLHYKKFTLGFEGEYFSARLPIKRVYIASGAVSYLDDTLISRYSEWQTSAALSYCYNSFFVPYGAVKYANCKWRLANGENIVIESNTNTFFYNLRNQRNLGYVLGLTLCPGFCERLAVTAEARFLDEKAFHVSCQIRF